MAKEKELSIEEAQARVEKLEAEARALQDARAYLAQLKQQVADKDRAERIARLPAMCAPATLEVTRSAAEPLLERGVAALKELREVLVAYDRLFVQQEAVAIGAVNEAAALGIPCPVRVLGRGLGKAWFLDRLRGFGILNSGLYVEFPTESERDAAIVAAINVGDVPPVGSTLAEHARQLVAGRTSSEIHSAARAAELEVERANVRPVRGVPSITERTANWFGHRRVEGEQPPPEAA